MEEMQLNTLDQQIRMYEELAINSHPALQTQLYDGWQLRFSNGYTGRANSISMLYPSTIDEDEKIAECERRYAEQKLACNFKITDVTPKAFDQKLEQRGYKIVTPTHLMIASLEDKSFQTDATCITTSSPDELWLKTCFDLHDLGENSRKTATAMFANIKNPAVYCRLTDPADKSKSIAVASAVIENGYMVLLNVIVDPALRGKGFGRKLCESVFSEAKKAGAKNAYLQVVEDNLPAIKLYESYGFSTLYNYWYRVK